jgi:hypothetical protein
MSDLNLIERTILRREAMSFFKKYWPTITAAVGTLIPFLLPSLLAYVQAHPHTTVGVLLAAFIAAYHSTAPKDQNTLKAILLVGCLLVCFPAPSQAQTNPTNIYAAGISFNNAGTPAIAGTGLYARAVNDASGTYIFTVVDALPTNLKPFTVTSNFGGGIAQKIFSIGKVPIFIPSSAGISFNGTNTGWAWSTGAIAPIKLSAKSNWRIFPTVRIAKSSVSNGTGYQPIVGILFGWGS